MPELPDVETMRRYLEREALRSRIVRIDVLDRRELRGLPPAELAAEVEGKRFSSTARHGKWLFARMDQAPWLLMHFGMTGSITVTPADEPPPAHARVAFRLDEDRVLYFRDQRIFGRVGVVDDPDAFAANKHLGPDALDPTLTESSFAERLASRTGPLKGVLLDQRFVAGLGNIYADEVCHEARIGPLSRVEHLGPEQRRALFRAMRDVLCTAVRYEAVSSRFPESWLTRERRPDGVCPGCGDGIARSRFQGRYTYWCPSCQPTL